MIYIILAQTSKNAEKTRPAAWPKHASPKHWSVTTVQTPVPGTKASGFRRAGGFSSKGWAGDLSWAPPEISASVISIVFNTRTWGIMVYICLYNLTHMMMFYEVSGMCPVKCLFNQFGDGMNDGKWRYGSELVGLAWVVSHHIYPIYNAP